MAKEEFKPGDKFILEIGEKRKYLNEYSIVGTDLYVDASLLKKLPKMNPFKEEITTAGFEELKAAYDHMNRECGFFCTDIRTKEESQVLVFKYFGIGIKMSFTYEFIEENEPDADDIIFTGNPYVHFSIYCYRIITDFIETLQKNRADKNAMNEFIDYLMKKIIGY